MALINKFVAIANGIRTLDDSTEKYSLDEMASSVDEANAEIDTQAAKIAELSTILEGKASGGGENVELVTLTIDWNRGSYGEIYFPFYDETTNQWSFCINGGASASTHYDYNNDRPSYKVRKNGVGCFPTGLWRFIPSDAVELLSDDSHGVYRFLADATADFD